VPEHHLHNLAVGLPFRFLPAAAQFLDDAVMRDGLADRVRRGEPERRTW